uniref:RNase H type-1 domain-containing protein n=1 Tax=Cannabis sativa TaxID=3483 RepID=A0A803QB34_CANSA
MCSDVLIWGKDNSGIFNVKSAYHLAISPRDIPSSSSPLGNKCFWSKLWFSPILAKDFESANLKAEGICNVQRSSISPPSLVAPSRYKINTDAAIDINLKKHSLGVVVRDAQDQVIAGIIAPAIGNVSPEIAEAKALLLALEWAQSVNLPVDVVESDCKSLVDKVNGSFSNYSVMSDFVVRIRHLLSFNPTCILSYVPRELNKLAHNCARAGLGLDGEYSWNGCLPSWLS